MVKIKIFICTIWIAAFCVTIGGCKSYRQSRKQNRKLYNAIETNEVEAAKEAIDDGANMNSFRNIGLTMDVFMENQIKIQYMLIQPCMKTIKLPSI